MKRIISLVLSLVFFCSSIVFGYAENEVLIEESEILVEESGIDYNEPNLQQDVLIESSLIDNNEQDVAETEEDTLFLDDSVSLENDVIKTDDNKTEDKMYLKVAAGKTLFSDVDLSEPQIILAQDIVVLGLSQETYYFVQYADSEGVKSAYASIYDVSILEDGQINQYLSNAENAVFVDNYVLVPVAVNSYEIPDSIQDEQSDEIIAIGNNTEPDGIEIADSAITTIEADEPVTVSDTDENEEEIVSQDSHTEVEESASVIDTDDEEEIDSPGSNTEGTVAAPVVDTVEEKEDTESPESIIGAEEGVATITEDGEEGSNEVEPEDKPLEETVHELEEHATEADDVSGAIHEQNAVVDGSENNIENQIEEPDSEEIKENELPDITETEDTDLVSETGMVEEEIVDEESEDPETDSGEVSKEGAGFEKETADADSNLLVEGNEDETDIVETAQDEADEATAEAEENLETAAEEETLVLSEEVIVEEAYMASGEDDFIYEDPDTKTIIKGYKATASGGTIRIPATVKTIRKGAFAGNNKIFQVIFSGDKCNIEEAVFKDCTSLVACELPDSYSETNFIPNELFSGCINLQTICTPTNEEYDDTLAWGTVEDSVFGKYILPSTLKGIGDAAFRNCKKLERIELPIQLSRVGKEAFYGCSSLTDVIISGDRLEYIGENAFAGLNASVYFTFTKKIRNQGIIGENAFGTEGILLSYPEDDIWTYCQVHNSPRCININAYYYYEECINIKKKHYDTRMTLETMRSDFANKYPDSLTCVEMAKDVRDAILLNYLVWYSIDQTAKSIINDLFLVMLRREPTLQEIEYYLRAFVSLDGLYMGRGIEIGYDYLIYMLSKSSECINRMSEIGIIVGNIYDDYPYDDINFEIVNFVFRLYTDILERIPDREGLRNWYFALMENRYNAYTVSLGFFNSKEFKNRKNSWAIEGKRLGIDNYVEQKVVETFYKVYLDREPVSPEQNGWVDLLYHGVSETYLQRGFVHSTEFTRKASNAGIPRGDVTLTEARDMNPAITHFVWRCYHYGLNRNPEPAGINDWCSQILNKTKTYDGVARGVLLSKEMENRKLSNSDWLETVYHIYFDRASDKAGKADWMKDLNGGISKNKVLDGFSNSQEFANLLKKLKLPK